MTEAEAEILAILTRIAAGENAWAELAAAWQRSAECDQY